MRRPRLLGADHREVGRAHAGRLQRTSGIWSPSEIRTGVTYSALMPTSPAAATRRTAVRGRPSSFADDSGCFVCSI